jgi:MFS transporter, ACDE family, multidrug resistance protein
MSEPLVARESRPILYLIFGLTLTGVLSHSLLAPAIPDILDDFGKDDSSAGLLVAVGSMPGIVLAPLIGILADRWGRRRVLVPCLLVFGVFGIVAATAQSYEVLILARFAMGFGSAAMVNIAIVLISDHFPAKDRIKLIGRNSSVLTLGLAVVPLTSGLITELFSWRWAMGGYSIALVTAFAAFFVLDADRPEASSTVREQLGGAKVALKDPRIMTTLVVGVLMFALVFGVFLTILPNHLESEFGLSAGWRGAIIALPALPSTFMAFNLGRIQDRFGLAHTLVGCAVGWAIAFAVIAAAPLLGLLAAGTLLYGMGEGALIPSLQGVAIDAAPPEHRAAVVAVWMSSARMGQTLGPIAAGAMMVGASTTIALWAGFALAVVMAIVLAMSPLGRSNRVRATR